MARVLSAKFFDRSSVVVARELLGKYLVRRYRGRTTALMITEAEAYEGPRDKASHAYRGRTERNAVMFEGAGRWYVYFIYGMYWMLNVVAGPHGYPAAVLIRGVEGAPGPGRLTKALRIDKGLNGRTAGRASGLWIEDRGVKVPRSRIVRTPRIGVAYAGEWAAKPYRFFIKK